jgi:CubicO group peptidase (beta-lactamase class C family)
MPRIAIAAALAAATLLVAPAAAQEVDRVSPERAGFSEERLGRIGDYLDRRIAAGEIAGGVALVARDGRIVHLEARGLSDIAANTPMQEDAIFRIASMTKPVAAVAILMLVEEGKVRLSDPVSMYLPSYRGMKAAVPEGPAQGASSGPGAAPLFTTVAAERDITVLDVLTHSSGLMSGPASNAGGQAAFQRRHEIGLSWVDNLGSETVLEFQPGSRWSYSPVAGLDVAARIVEIASRQTFDAFLRERLFGPLAMDDTFFWPSDAQRARLVTSYVLGEGGLSPNPNADSMSGPVYFSGGGGLMSSAESYARFAMMLANGGEWDGVRILSPASVALMGSQILPDTLPGRQPGEGYGLGVRSVSDRALRRTMIADGSFGWSGAYGTHFWVDPENKLTGVLMVQVSGLPLGESIVRSGEFETAVMQALME